MDPVIVLVFGLLGAGIVVCLIIHLVQQGGAGGQQALGTAQAMLNQVGDRARLRVTVTTRNGDAVSVAADGGPVAQPVVSPASVSQAAAPAPAVQQPAAQPAQAGTP